MSFNGMKSDNSMSEVSSSIRNITTLSELDYENIDPLLRAPTKIIKELFSSSTVLNFENFVLNVGQYIQLNPSNNEPISNILGVFSVVRPKQQELLTKIENAISITHSSAEYNFKSIFSGKLPSIFNLDIPKSPILEFIKNDDFENLQKFVSTKVDFDSTQTFEIRKKYVNLLDICAYYGSIRCFKYFVCNKAPFSGYVCPFSICGGNYEIIHYLENNYKEQNFEDEICLKMSIAYHRYEITDWLILNYGLQITDAKTAIESFNFSVLSSFVSNNELSSDELLTSAKSGNLPVVQYLCEVAKFNAEAITDIYGRTALQFACSGGSLPIVQYLCEVAKVNPEAKDKFKQTPLHKACEKGCLPVVQYLCEVAKVNTEATAGGRTALYWACLKGRLPVVQYLCEVQKVDTEAKDINGLTPLHIACEQGSLPVVQYLCEVAKVNTEGAYEKARSEEVKEYLKKYISK